MSDGANPLRRHADDLTRPLYGAPPVQKKAKVAASSMDTCALGGDAEFGHPPAFAWQKAARESDASKRLDTKEYALRRGMQYAQRVRSGLAPVISRGGVNAPALSRWVASLDELKKADSEFRVHIGLAGSTGAGKTSAINAIIGFEDLLPANSYRAATSVPCLVAYNEATGDGQAFRAVVTFSTEEAIRNRVGAAGEPSSTALRHLFSIVLGRDPAHFEGETLDTLLATYADVGSLLGQTRRLADDDAEVFSRLVLPYLDSVRAVHGPSGLEFAAWPLIVKVEVFVRSPVLLRGVVLVDLPGLDDIETNRVSVAEKYFPKLSATAVVAPIVRAVSHDTAVGLVVANQLLGLATRDQAHQKQSCVVLSKMEDIHVPTFLRAHAAEASRNQALEQCRQELATLHREFDSIRAEKSVHQRALGAYAKEADGTASVAKTVELVASEEKTLEDLAAVNDRVRLNRNQAAHLEGQILRWCIRRRNAVVQGQIQAGFAKRRHQLAVDLPTSPDHLTLETFPVSSSAYWKVSKHPEYRQPPGFETVDDTGIPALRRWLQHAPHPVREAHVNSTLESLRGLFASLSPQLSAPALRAGPPVSQQFVMVELLFRPLLSVEAQLDGVSRWLCPAAQALHPFQRNDGVRANLRARCFDVLYRLASAAGSPPSYDWLEPLYAVLFPDVVDERGQCLRDAIPALERRAHAAVDLIWNELTTELLGRAEVFVPHLLPVLNSPALQLDGVKLNLKSMVTSALVAVVEAAEEARGQVLDLVAGELKPYLDEVKTQEGDPSDGILFRAADALSSAAFVDKAVTSVEVRLGTLLAGLPSRLARVRGSICRDVVKAVVPFIRPDPVELVRRVVAEWEAVWLVGHPCGLSPGAAALAVPASYGYPGPGFDAASVGKLYADLYKRLDWRMAHGRMHD